MVLAAVERVRPVAAPRHVAVVSDFEDGAYLRVTGEKNQLISAVANLVDHAVKYSDARSSVNVTGRLRDGWVEVAVSDRGIGIPPQDLERVFERFYRVDRARSRETGGTGLGLSIVRHVVTNHEGEVTVCSTEGEGSTFTLRIPARPD